MVLVTSDRSGADFTVLVNSCDAFEDCWFPFFQLLTRYWPELAAPVLLNTEKKSWSWPELKLGVSRVAANSAATMTWSECLIAALDQVTTPLVLYMQEDYFLRRRVRNSVVLDAALHMAQNPSVSHVALSQHGSRGPFDTYVTPEYQLIRPRAAYRISTQAALWRKDVLRSYVRPEENGWMFEIFGTLRAWRRANTFLVANFTGLAGPAMDYLHTGIIKGAWHRDIPAQFQAEGIDIDFSRRGFYVEKPTLLRRIETGRKLLSEPRSLFRSLRAR